MIETVDVVNGGNTASFKHGRSGYSKHHCRCDVCRKGASEYKKAHRIENHDKLLDQERQARLRNLEAFREHARRRYASNPEELIRKQEYRAKNPEKWIEYAQSYHAENREKEGEYRRNAFLSDPVKFKIRTRKWRAKNRDQYRKLCREYLRMRRTDPAFRLGMNLRSRIRKAIRRGDKSARSMELIGCTVMDLRSHLERQFKDGMTWDNYGKNGWHVDHIRPCSSFDLSKPEEQRKCFYFTNLQPLWAEDNHTKSDRWCLPKEVTNERE